MKNFYDLLRKPLFVAAFVMTFSYAHAQDGNLLIKEGKTWECFVGYPAGASAGGDSVKITTIYKIEGDTIINGIAYKKMLANGKFCCGMRQDGQKVYKDSYEDKKDVLFYDFGLEVGDEYRPCDVEPDDVWNSFVVIKTDTIEVGGIPYKRLGFINAYRYYEDPENCGSLSNVWVEGIGHSEDILSPSKFFMFTGGDYEMRKCFDNGKCIFTYLDFWRESTNGIATPTQEKTESKDAPVYDLAGRRVEGKALHRGIYIRNGKKFVVN